MDATAFQSAAWQAGTFSPTQTRAPLRRRRKCAFARRGDPADARRKEFGKVYRALYVFRDWRVRGRSL